MDKIADKLVSMQASCASISDVNPISLGLYQELSCLSVDIVYI